MKQNKFRNLFAIAAIILTSVLFSVTFTLTAGIIRATEEQVMRQVGTSAHGGYKDLTQNQYDKLIQSPLIQDYSYNIHFANAANEQLQKRAVELRYTEAKNFDWSMMKLEQGHLPKEKMDVVLDTFTLQALGIEAEVGQMVTLSYEILGTLHQDNFMLSGYYEGDSMLGASEAYFSKEYVKEVLSVKTEQEWKELSNDGITNGIGLLQLNIFFRNSSDIEGNIIQVIKDCGFQEGEIDYGINWAYASTGEADMLSIVLIVSVVLIILTAGYLMIYNIFYISIVHDIRFYGLLKTVGTTGKQIRSLIRRQSDILCLVGIPLGTIAGWLIGNLFVPFAAAILSGDIKTSFIFQPAIFLFSIIFSYVTVRISCRRPGKIASDISPIEAAIFQENTRYKRKQVKSNKKLVYFGMARRNLGRSRKKTAYVVISMSLGLALLMTVFTVVNSFSIDKYVSSMLGGADYFVTSASQQSTNIPKDIAGNLDGLDSTLKDIGGITGERVALGETMIGLQDKKYLERYQAACDTGLIHPYDENDLLTKEKIKATMLGDKGITLSMYGWNYEALKNLNVLKGTLDKKKYNSGDYIVLTADKEYSEERVIYDMGHKIFDIGDKVMISGKEYEVLAFAEMPYQLSKRSYSYNGMFAVLPFHTVEQFAADSLYFLTYGSIYQIGEGGQNEIEKRIKAYTEFEDFDLTYLSKDTVSLEFKELEKMITIIGGTLCIFVGLIAMMNFVNSVITGILTRKREFAMLKSVGMERQQLLKILYWESAYYLLYAYVLAAIAGTFMSYCQIRPFAAEMTWLSYQFTLMPLAVSLPPLAILAFLVPNLVYRRSSKESVVELLREE